MNVKYRDMFKAVYKNFLPKRMRSQVDIFPELRKLLCSWDVLNEDRVLVIAPHMDDEIIACAGVMHRYVKRGAHVTVVYMTDGRRGNPDYDGDTLTGLRKAETKVAADLIGVKDLVYLDNPERELENSTATRGALMDLINTRDPQAVFFPFCYDGHRDHVAASRLFLDVAKENRLSPKCYAYTVWSPIIPNLTVNITEEIEVKKQALEVFKTQIEVFDLIDMTLSISRYMGYAYGKWKGYSENFVVCSVGEHLRLAELYDGKRV